jgi:hypothetical protein
MKIEFIDDISNGGEFKGIVCDKLIRLFDFDSNEAYKFQMTIKALIEEESKVNLSVMSYIKSVNCSLTLTVSHEDVGIVQTEKSLFECRLTKNAYREMVQLIQPFVDRESDGYQWLCDTLSDIDFLFSPGGTW